MNILFTRHKSAGQQKNEKGFSLIELVLVVVVIGIIATIVIARFQSAVKASNESSAVSGLKLIHSAQTTYRANAEAFGSMDNLMATKTIDEAFGDDDSDPNTGERSGYKYLITITGENNFILSAIPVSTGINGSGNKRFGTDASGSLYRDDNNLTSHYLTETELRGGTSVPYDSN